MILEKTPFIIFRNDSGYKPSFDLVSNNGAEFSESFAKLFGYEIVYRGYVHNYKEFEMVLRTARLASLNGRFNPDSLDDTFAEMSED